MAELLEVQALWAGYGNATVLEDISFNLEAGASLALLGRNGMGKTTLLATLMGATRQFRGSIRFDARDLTVVPSHRRAHAGLGWVPQERDIFRSLTVEENLTIGAFARPAEAAPEFRHLVVTGPAGPGKTNLAVGIGTEFADRLGKGRYVGLSGLLHLIGAPPAPAGLLDYDDGRALWPLAEADLLIVDDVDVGLDTKALLTPEALESALVALKGQKPLGWLAGRRSVWVLGEGSSPEGWQVTLARLIGTDGRSIRTVRLPLTVPAASVSELERVSG